MIVRRCSLWSPCSYDPATVALVEQRMAAMGMHKEQFEDHYIYYRANSRQARPLLRFNTTSNTLCQIGPPDTNAARRCTSEVVTTIDIDRDGDGEGDGDDDVEVDVNVDLSVAEVQRFLAACKYSKLSELAMAGMRWTILGCTLEAVAINASAGMLLHLHTTASGPHHGSIASAEDRLLKVAHYLSDIVSLKHIDNAIIKQ